MYHIIINPALQEFESLCKRPIQEQSQLMSGIQTVFDEIGRHGDKALASYTLKFDHVKLESSIFHLDSIDIGEIQISQELKEAIQIARQNIGRFHKAQVMEELVVETMPGIVCEQKYSPIQNIGVYIPGGSAPLFSTVLMLCIPAKIAGCQRVLLCTPPDRAGSIHPAILYAAKLCGVTEIRLAGGAQAIAAMTLGTSEIQKVDKIFGPGNQYVTAAKQIAQNYGVGIDMPAGPSEVLVFADKSGIPAFVAADLLAQAEHGADSQVVLITQEQEFAKHVLKQLEIQIADLPRREIALLSLQSSRFMVIEDTSIAFEFINEYAPEHLIIASANPDFYVPFIKNAGSVFLGNYCPESAGDYASGTNHTLPTNGWAKSASGVNLDAFFKKITFQRISMDGITSLGNTIITMAEGEQLQAHANAVKIRLNNKI